MQRSGHHSGTQMSLEEQPLEDDRRLESVQADEEAAESQRQLEQLRKEIAENEKRKRELVEIETKRRSIEDACTELNIRLKKSISEVIAERKSMLSEADQLENIAEAFRENLQKLEQIKPRDWDNETFLKNEPRVKIVLGQIESDFDDASIHCQTMKHTEILCTSGWKTQMEYNLRLFWWQFQKGLAFHLPLFLLLLIAFLISNCSHTSSL